MIEAYGDLWTWPNADVLCITTNGIVAGNSEKGTLHAVMGKGVAEQAANRFPGLSKHFAVLLNRHGNRPMILMRTGDHVPPSKNPVDPLLVSFPVKHHWRERADLALIEQSARQIVEMADKFGWSSIVLPRPGCSNGQLQWSEVREVIEPILDDRFTVITT
jgi:hypothetical protein